MPARSRTVLHFILYSAVIALISGAFLAEILRGGCPVP